MKSERGWPGVICCFMLFIAVCFFLLLNKDVAIIRSPGHREFGLLLFIIPGVISGLLASELALLKTIVGSMLAVPVCLLMIRCAIEIPRSLWQELAWLSSAVFWCALGALICEFLWAVFSAKRGRY